MKLIPGGNLESADPNIPVRWCIDRAESEILKQRRAQNIFILFIIVYEKSDLEDRLLVPIDQMMAWLEFRRPGKHLLLAKVVWGSDADYLKKIFLNRSGRRRYAYDYLNRERTAFREDSYFREESACLVLPGEADIEVVVPKEHFPKEAPEWLKRVANMCFESSAVDQCQFRRRLLMTPLKLVGLALLACLIIAVRAFGVLLFGVLLGLRVDFKAFFRPWDADIDDVIDGNFRHSWALFKNNRLRSRWFILCHPSILALLFLPVPLIVKHHYHVSYLVALMIVGKALAHAATVVGRALIHFFSKAWTIFASVALTAGLIIFVIRLVEKASIKKKQLERTPEFRARVEDQQRDSYDRLYKLLACSTSPLVPALSALPPERRTFRLRYLNLKAKVCRPFAAS